MAPRAIHEAAGRVRGVVLTRQREGRALLKLERFDEARETLESAHLAAASAGEERLAAQSLTNLGQVHLAQGRHQAAVSPLLAAIATLTRLGAARPESRARVALADVYAAQEREELERALALVSGDDPAARDIWARLG
ncbi:Tetratricopeptide repeat-containing protein [Sinosporangium album]|uniref:Tetratricopeptide repeat-containing protein n=1 Tax=Sinosporangium album TaxID=504805 RepID=A0A1G8EF51_9ACTN|nr:tetratricopeptide repeat protein [Sinosporangium album]SDH68525.1 Tetratricopeptide repeat-containing protein [Sinosporangium album]